MDEIMETSKWNGRRVQALRYALKESTTEFGARFGRSRRTVETWEGNTRTPDVMVRRELDRIVARRQLEV